MHAKPGCIPEYQPEYKWRETWPGEGHQDFVCFDADLQFGRIYLDLTSGSRARQWRWAINTIPWQRQNILPHNGWAPTGQEASRKVEELYEQIKALHGR